VSDDVARRTLEAFAQVPALVGVVRGPDHIIEFANDRFRHAAGLADPIGRPMRDLKVYPENLSVVATLDLVRRTGQPWSEAESHVQMDVGGGEMEERWYSVDVRPIRDADGGIDRALIHAFDVSEQVRARATIAKSEAQMRRLFDSDMLGMAYWDQSGAITAANDEFLRIIGYSQDDLREGRIDWRAMTPQEYFAQENRALAEITERGVCTPFEKEYIRKDGGRVPILIGGGTFERGSSGGVTFALDLTKRTQAELGRRRAEQLLRSVLAHAPIVLFALDEHGRVTLAEGRGLGMAGKAGDTLVGTSALERHGHKPRVGDHMRRALAGEEFAAEAELDGVVLETYYQPLRDLHGRLAGTVGVSLDITMRKRFEAERETAQVQLVQRQKLESLGVLAGGIAHDFNNLLAVILGNASHVLASSRDPKTTDRLEDVVKAARRASELTRQMLAYAGKAPIAMRPIDLGLHVREISKLLESSLPKKVQLVLELQHDLVVDADVAQVDQVVMNLVINAAEAVGDASGVVTVRVFSRHVDEHEVGSLSPPAELPPGRCVVLEVRDTGIGMDAVTKARIFDPFFTTKLAGRGLGLAAVLGIVRSHRGAIRIASEPRNGSTFEILFPVSDRLATSSRPTPHPVARADGVVLVVDDERAVRAMVREILAEAGFRVLEAADGREAIDVFRSHGKEIAAVVLDVNMPGIGGEETFAALRALRSDVPVVITSGYDEHEATRRFATPGLTAFLKKPYTADELTASVSKAIRGERTPA
jgi:two-component system cell cycle sensor histidine kinase/response regulator CckA